MIFISPYCSYCRSQPCICMPLNPPTNSSEPVYTKLQLEVAVLAEREACAKVCDAAKSTFKRGGFNNLAIGANECAVAIRARSNK